MDISSSRQEQYTCDYSIIFMYPHCIIPSRPSIHPFMRCSRSALPEPTLLPYLVFLAHHRFIHGWVMIPACVGMVLYRSYHEAQQAAVALLHSQLPILAQKHYPEQVRLSGGT